MTSSPLAHRSRITAGLALAALALALVAGPGVRTCFAVTIPDGVLKEKVEPPKPANADSAAADSAAADKEIVDLGGGRYQVGAAVIDTQSRSVQVTGRVNMDHGAVELLACTPAGKVHESVLCLDVEPYHLQVALLLLGLARDESGDVVHRGPGKPAGPDAESLPGAPGGANAGGAPGDDPAVSSTPRGDSVVVWVEWKDASGAARGMRAEGLVWNVAEQKPMPRTWWAFTGSCIVDGVFVAQREGSLIATYFDSYALLNNPLSSRDNDDLFSVNHTVTPPKGTPVTVTLYDAKAFQEPAGK